MYQRFDFGEQKVKPDAIIAFVLGVVAAYILQVFVFGPLRAVFTTLVVTAVAGAWYHWRKIL